MDRTPRVYTHKWPDLEDALYTAFLQHREAGRIVTGGWFRRKTKLLWGQIYPYAPWATFYYSVGWLRGFFKRYMIVRRRLTKMATKLPGEYVTIVNSFL